MAKGRLPQKIVTVPAGQGGLRRARRMPESHGGNPLTMVTRRKTASRRELDATVCLHQPRLTRATGYGIGIEEDMGRIINKCLSERAVASSRSKMVRTAFLKASVMGVFCIIQAIPFLSHICRKRTSRSPSRKFRIRSARLRDPARSSMIWTP